MSSETSSPSGEKKISRTAGAGFTADLKSNSILLGAVILLILPLTFILGDFGEKRTTQVLVLGLPLLLTGFLNFRIALLLFLGSLFIDINPVYLFSLSFLVIPYLLLVFVVTNKGFETRDLKSPFLWVTVFFVLTMIPSFFNSLAKTAGGFNMFMWPGFILLFSLFAVVFKDEGKINFLAKAYLWLVSLNALFAIYQGITTGRRAFGFAGIMFVDILGIAIIMVFILLLHAKGKEKAGYAVLFAILILAMIFNKTRNVWVNVALVMFLSFIHVAIQAGSLQMERRKVVKYGVIALLFVALTGGLLISFYGTTFFRLEEKQKLSAESLEVADVNNSLVTRYFIWSTGYTAFAQNPFFGMGMYSFAYSSKFYNGLPDNIYKKFVSGLTLHHGYYSMLVETGIVGFTGLLIFLFVLFRNGRKIYREASGTPRFLQAFIAFWAMIYIFTSLMFTDAWFWGRGIVMFGIVLGVLSAIDNMNESNPAKGTK